MEISPLAISITGISSPRNVFTMWLYTVENNELFQYLFYRKNGTDFVLMGLELLDPVKQ